MTEAAALPPLAASSRTVPATTYDAILLAGFGGPEGQEDVIPFPDTAPGAGARFPAVRSVPWTPSTQV